jgi:hypothetical protein
VQLRQALSRRKFEQRYNPNIVKRCFWNLYTRKLFRVIGHLSDPGEDGSVSQKLVQSSSASNSTASICPSMGLSRSNCLIKYMRLWRVRIVSFDASTQFLRLLRRIRASTDVCGESLGEERVRRAYRRTHEALRPQLLEALSGGGSMHPCLA